MIKNSNLVNPVYKKELKDLTITGSKLKDQIIGDTKEVLLFFNLFKKIIKDEDQIFISKKITFHASQNCNL